MAVTLKLQGIKPFVKEHELGYMAPLVKACHQQLHQKTGAGNDFLGWVDLPLNYDKQEFDRIKKPLKKYKKIAKCLLSLVSAVPTWVRNVR